MKEAKIEEYIDEYGPYVLRFCLSMTKNRYMGEELYQDTFLLLLTNREDIDPEDNVKGYLMSVAARLWRDRKRKYARRNRIAPTISAEEELLSSPSDMSTEEEMERNLLHRDVNRAIEELDEKTREVILLQYMGQLTQEEISKRLKIPIGTVKSRVYYGKKKLKDRLEEWGYGPE